MNAANEGEVTVSELSRQVRDVLVNFERAITRINDTFVTKEVLDLRLQAVDNKTNEQKRKIDSIQTDLDNNFVELKVFQDVEKRVASLEDDKKWLSRLVLGLIIVAIIGGYVLSMRGGMAT